MKPRDYQKFIYGNNVGHDLTPTVANLSATPSMFTPSGSAVITCNTATPGGTRTYGAITYNDGDILFYTDGHQIWDSTHALMLGCPAAPTGLGVGGNLKAQCVFVARAPTTLNGAQGLNNEVFWVFTNLPGTGGISVSVVDMSRNGGLGEVDPAIGHLLESNANGVDDRMTGWCMETLGVETGVGIISHQAHIATQNWMTWLLTAAGGGTWGNGPDPAAIPIWSAIGPTYNNPNESSELNSCVKINGDNTKVATVYQAEVGTGAHPQTSALLCVYTLDPTTGILTDYNSTVISIKDYGAVPAAAGVPPRIKAYDVEWDRVGTSATSYLYVPNFNVLNSKIEINWYIIDAVNTFGAGGSISTSLYDATGATKRQILSMVRDPFNDRMFITAPPYIISAGAYSAYPVDYPEYYSGDFISVLDNIDDPTATIPVWTENYLDITVVGTRTISKGLPNINACGVGTLGNTYYVKPCENTVAFICDDNDTIYEIEMAAGTLAINTLLTSITPAACIGCGVGNSILSLKVDSYNGYHIFFCDAGSGNYCLHRFNYWAISAPIGQAITVDAWWGSGTADFRAFAIYKTDGSVNPTGGFSPLTCTTHYALGETNVVGQFAIANIDYSAFPGAATVATGAGLTAGEKFTPADPPTGLVVMDVLIVPAQSIAKVIAGKHIWHLNPWLPAGGGAGVWVDQGDVCAAVGETNDLIDFQLGGDPATGILYLYAYTKDTRYDCDWLTGALSNPQLLTYLSSGLPIAIDVKSVGVLDMAAWQVPLKVTSTDWAPIDTLCSSNSVWTWESDLGGPPPTVLQLMGCFECVDWSYSWGPEWADLCTSLDFVASYDDCKNCLPTIDCKLLITCCSYESGYAPLEVVGVDSDLTLVAGDVYHEQTTSNKCTTVFDNDPALFMSVGTGNAYRIDESTGVCTVVSQGMIPGVNVDLAFDKHGNMVQSDGSMLGWSNPYGPSNFLYIGGTTVSTSMDFDMQNRLVSAEFLAGLTTWQIVTIDLAGTITPVTTWTDPTIDAGDADLTVHHTTMDYFIIGGAAGTGGGNSLYEIDSALHTVISGPFDLTITLSLNATDVVIGIENKKDLTTTLQILVNEPTSNPLVNHIKLYTCSLAGTLVTGPLYLINPATGTTDWENRTASGLAYRDTCAMWPTPIAHTLVSYASCTLCYTGAPDVCCYKLTDCTTSAVTYSQSNLSAYIGLIVQNATGQCYEVEHSVNCFAPVAFTVVLPTFGTCSDCIALPVLYYQLVNCLNPADILYTDDTATPSGTPGIGGYVGMVVRLTGENFCREVSVNPTGPAGGEATVSILSSASLCSDCHFYLKLIDCTDATNIVYVDYHTSPTLWPYIGAVNGLTLNIGGIPYTDCWLVDSMLGPTNLVYPIAVLILPFADCTACNLSGRTCVQVEHCCGPSYVANQIVDVVSGITVADIGSVVEADITIGATIYSGCWTVSADPGGPLCNNYIPAIDITAINTATVGSGNFGDCITCEASAGTAPCPPLCALLERCDDTTQTLTVTGAQGLVIGTDVVTLAGRAGCWRVCDSANSIHGIQWFYGDHLGIDFRTGTPMPDYSGQSDMTLYNAGPTNYTFRQSMVHCIQEAQTIGGHTFAAGDLMFYSDGRYIYDRTHTLMTLVGGAPFLGNAGNALGHTGYQGRMYAAQQCVVIPNEAGAKTGNVWHQYYVIYNTCDNGPISYSIIDMTLNGGAGEVLVASANTVLHTNSCEFMTVTTTSIDASPHWYLYDMAAMTTPTDWANNYVRGVKFSNAGISVPFYALDYGTSSGTPTRTKQERGTGELLVSPCNRYLVVRMYLLTAPNPYGLTSKILKAQVYSRDMTTGICNGPYGWTFGPGSTTGLMYNYILAANWGFSGGNAPDADYCCAFSSSGEMFFTGHGMHSDSARDKNSAYIYKFDIYRIGVDLPSNVFGPTYTSQNMLWFFPDDGSTSGATSGWVESAVTNNPTRCTNGFGDGWCQQSGETGAVMQDFTLSPDGRLFVAYINDQSFPNTAWQKGIGGFALGAENTILVLDHLNDSIVSGNFQAQIPSTNPPNANPYGVGARRMGNWFPFWLNTPCPCDPINITAETVTATVPSCQDPICLSPVADCYELTECDCTAGALYNACAVDNIATMPPNMVTYGKSWTPTCYSNVTHRWTDLKDAVAALGTSLTPGTNQTIAFTYSFIKAGTLLSINANPGPTSILMENGVGGNINGNNDLCASYTKTYPITFAQWQTEMGVVFTELKTTLEGMFNTTCGYGADLTVNFTDLGSEGGGATTLNPVTTQMNVGVSGVYTDSNGCTNIGDIRLAYGPTTPDCGGWAQGAQLGNIAYAWPAMNGDVVSRNGSISTIRSLPWTSVIHFDSNENWRKQLDAVVANSFEIVLIGLHELLHVFGLGHDFFPKSGSPASCHDNPPGSGTGSCGCPCYQMKPGCNPAGCFDMNNDALMGYPTPMSQAFATFAPTGLLGPEGIYERRGLCGVFGNSDPNYGCEDGTCLGCVHMVHYTQDLSVAPYVGGVIEWDPGDAAGLRCWEVDYENPCPVTTFTTPVTFSVGDPNGVCSNCTTGANLCWLIELCQCNTIPGAPAWIWTDVDLTDYCNGTLGNGPYIEIAAYPGVCWKIDCVGGAQGCPASGVVTITIVNTFYDCNDCCSWNTACYDLCPCNNLPSATNNCAAFTQIPFPNIGSFPAFVYYTDPANGIFANPVASYKYYSLSGASGICFDAGLYVYAWTQFQIYDNNTLGPLPGMPTTVYTTWSVALADLIAAPGPSGPYAIAGDDAYDMITNVNFIAADGRLGINGQNCWCTIPCTTVSNNLSTLVGQVVQLTGTPPAPLIANDCYNVQACPDPCGTGGCIPVGAVTYNPPVPECDDCYSHCLCYKLTDCNDPQHVLHNICPNAAIYNAANNGDIVKVDGRSECWIVECDDIINCTNNICLIAMVTAVYPSCTLCLGGPLVTYICNPAEPNCCETILGSGGYLDCATMHVNVPTCCPTYEYECIGTSPSCSCQAVPAGTGPGFHPTLAACMAAVGTCCSAIPDTYDCILNSSIPSYTCVLNTTGSGTFNNPGTALADCNACVATNCVDCYIESWNCDHTTGACSDPGDGTGTWNSSNGGLLACQNCTGCILDPLCPAQPITYDCQCPGVGCYNPGTGLGQYTGATALADCIAVCACETPEPGTFEGLCVNCFNEIEMKALFEKIADVCDDCNLPYGLTEQETNCDTSCFGNSNIYIVFDMSSTFAGPTTNRLQQLSIFKTDVIVPAFQQIKSEFPSYAGHLYILLGSWNQHLSGTCNDYNGSAMAVPGPTESHEQWLMWAQYPLSGNAGANGAAPNPFTGGTLPNPQRCIFGSTQVDGIGGLPMSCNSPAWDETLHGSLMRQIQILPGDPSYNDGFNQVDPWADTVNGWAPGSSDPYHEFEGGDKDAIVIIFQDESAIGYYEANFISGSVPSPNNWTNPIGVCGAPLWNGAPSTQWYYGLGPGGVLTTLWKTDYTNYMSLHEFGWDVNGVANAAQWDAKPKTMIYAGSDVTPSSSMADARRDFRYHLYQAIGGKEGTVDSLGHISCAHYIPIPLVYGHQCWAVTDSAIPNQYMGTLGGGDPSLTTGYKGGSLSNYGMSFHIPDYVITDLTSEMLYDLWKEYLSDC